MKKFTLLALSALVIPGFALANSYVCPDINTAQDILNGKTTSWNGWSVSPDGAPADTKNGTFLSVELPGKNAEKAPGQTIFLIGCTYTAQPNYPLSTTSIYL